MIYRDPDTDNEDVVRGTRHFMGDDNMELWIIYILIGVIAGISGGLFGIGGGIIVVPALIYFAHFSQHKATGTSLALLLPPLGLGAVMEYYRKGNVDFTAAGIMLPSMFFAMYAGAFLANRMKGWQLKMSFGFFLGCVSIYLVYGAWEMMKAES